MFRSCFSLIDLRFSLDALREGEGDGEGLGDGDTQSLQNHKGWVPGGFAGKTDSPEDDLGAGQRSEKVWPPLPGQRYPKVEAPGRTPIKAGRHICCNPQGGFTTPWPAARQSDIGLGGVIAWPPAPSADGGCQSAVLRSFAGEKILAALRARRSTSSALAGGPTSAARGIFSRGRPLPALGGGTKNKKKEN